MLKTNIKKAIIVGIIGLVISLLIPSAIYASSISREGVVGLVNRERIERGLNPVSTNQKLETAAKWKAEDMIEKDYWEHFHNGKSPWDWMKEADYNYEDAGENLAIDFTEVELMHQAWMNSPSHRDNIINSKYKEIGVGIAKGDYEGHETIIVVEMFGNPTVSEVASEKTSQPSVGNGQPQTKPFTVEADENKPSQNQNMAKSESNSFKKSFNSAKNIFLYLYNGYKSNVQKGYAQARSILLQNFSASANY